MLWKQKFKILIRLVVSLDLARAMVLFGPGTMDASSWDILKRTYYVYGPASKLDAFMQEVRLIKLGSYISQHTILNTIGPGRDRRLLRNNYGRRSG